jgi:hypothetical protein
VLRRGTQMRITDVIEHAASSSHSLLANQAGALEDETGLGSIFWITSVSGWKYWVSVWMIANLDPRSAA